MSNVKIVVQEQSVAVDVMNDTVYLYQSTGQTYYPDINAVAPITYDITTKAVGIDQTQLEITSAQVTGNFDVSRIDGINPSASHAMPFGIVTDIPGHYLVSMGSNIVNQIIPEGRIFYCPMYMSNSAHVDRIAIEVASSASYNGVLRLGIYDSNANGLPGNLLVDAGTVDSSIVGVKQAVIDLTLEGLVWIAVVSQNNQSSVKSFTQIVQPYPSATTGAVSAGKLALSQTELVYALLPSTASSNLTGVTYYTPIMNLRLA